jgi:hypothetical protein
MAKLAIGRRLGRLAAAAAVAMLGVGAVSLDAGATVSCPGGGYVCVWKDASYQSFGDGAKSGAWSGDDNAYGNDYYYNTTTSPHDSVSSVVNFGNSCNVRMYKDVSGGGASFLQVLGSGDSDLGNASGPVGFNDSLDSHRWCVA